MKIVLTVVYLQTTPCNPFGTYILHVYVHVVNNKHSIKNVPLL